MATSLKVYADAALSSVVYNPNILQKLDGTTGPVDLVFYFGSALTGKKIEALSNPGIDNIVLGVSDANASSGQSAAAVKLSATKAGLDTATAGASLSLGAQILSGAAGAVPVHARIQATLLTVGAYSGLSLNTNDLVEVNA